jgi:hypothetical protein
MSALTDFLHKLVDHVGASGLHSDIDELAKDEGETAVKAVESDADKGEGETTSA